MINLDPDNIVKALGCISSGIVVAPNIIKEAETALLSWENENPSSYALHLLQVLTNHTNHTTSNSNNPLRLAAALTIKAMVGRKWKDRGRLSKKTPLNLIDHETKIHIRNMLLSFITTGGLHGNYIGNHHVAISIIRDKSLMVRIQYDNMTPHDIWYYDEMIQEKRLKQGF
jgi:hypothetical protein